LLSLLRHTARVNVARHAEYWAAPAGKGSRERAKRSQAAALAKRRVIEALVEKCAAAPENAPPQSPDAATPPAEPTAAVMGRLSEEERARAARWMLQLTTPAEFQPLTEGVVGLRRWLNQRNDRCWTELAREVARTLGHAGARAFWGNLLL